MREKSLHHALVLAVAGAVVGLSAAANAAPVLGTYSSSADLDLSGTFLYAIDVGGTGTPHVVSGLSFTDDNVAGATVFSNHNDFGYQAPNYDGGGTAEDSLEAIGNTIQWSNGGTGLGALPDVTMDLAVTPGVAYKLQLLFQDDASGNRGFDVYAEGVNIVDNFGSSTGNLTSGRLITYEFTAGDGTFSIGLDGDGGGHADVNPILSAATLEIVPEPASLSLIGLGLPLLLRRQRRR